MLDCGKLWVIKETSENTICLRTGTDKYVMIIKCRNIIYLISTHMSRQYSSTLKENSSSN